MKSPYEGSWIVAVFALATIGCTTNEDRCQELCEWADECGTSDVDCSDQSVIDECVDDIEDAGEDCEDALDEFLSCVDDNNECEAIERSCGGEASEVLEHCATRENRVSEDG